MPASYTAETDREDPKDHLIETVPETNLPEDIHHDVRERVEHAMQQLRAAMGKRNMLHACANLLDELEQCHAKYAGVPVLLYEEYLRKAATDMRADEAVILDDAASPEKRHNALFRHGSRAIRITGIAWKNSVKAGESISKVGKGAVALGGAVTRLITTYVLSRFL